MAKELTEQQAQVRALFEDGKSVEEVAAELGVDGKLGPIADAIYMPRSTVWRWSTGYQSKTTVSPERVIAGARKEAERAAQADPAETLKAAASIARKEPDVAQSVAGQVHRGSLGRERNHDWIGPKSKKARKCERADKCESLGYTGPPAPVCSCCNLCWLDAAIICPAGTRNPTANADGSPQYPGIDDQTVKRTRSKKSKPAAAEESSPERDETGAPAEPIEAEAEGEQVEEPANA